MGTTKRTDVVIVGGGQAGLAMSHGLSERGVDHVVLERGRVGERWISERWSSLRLLSPNWQTRLPGYHYQGDDPHGYMTSGAFASHLEGYARAFSAPVQRETSVRAVTRSASGYAVATDQGAWDARSVVIATGHCDRPHVPEMASRLAGDIAQLTPSEYRSPDQLADGGVLVVGASATGVQLADELQRSGRQVTLAVSHHVRLPRRYRGRDIMWWLDGMGLLSERAEAIRDLAAARRAPSWQLVGRDDHRNVDLPSLQARGVRLCGRVVNIDGARVALANDLAESTEQAERKMVRLLARADAFATVRGLDATLPPEGWPTRFRAEPGPSRINLRRAGIRSVIWATGYRRSYPWLRVPGALDRRGELSHHGGVMAPAGLYALGLQLMRRRNSSFIDGVGSDAIELTNHLTGWLDHRHSHAA